MGLIGNMEMVKALFEKDCIKTQKAFFGLKTKVIYTPTNSIMVGECLEYSPAAGEKIKEMLSMPDDQLLDAVPKMGFWIPVENGMYCLSLCFSRDHQFAALQLCKYIEFEYRPVSGVRFFEGPIAESLLRIIVK